MMACKAWIFDHCEHWSSFSSAEIDSHLDYDIFGSSPSLRALNKQPDLRSSSLAKILRLDYPRIHKTEGGKVTGFNEEDWNKVCSAVVSAGIVARARAQPALMEVLRK